MNIRDLEYLVAVADLKHFSKAAERCNVSQPTLSSQLKKLETFLGVQLMERNNRRVLLTPTGEEIVARARILLQEAEGIKELARASSNPMSGKLELGLIPTLAPYLLPLISRPIHDRFPEMQLLLHEQQTAVLVQQLKNGELDAAVMAVPVDDADVLDDIRLFDEPFYLAVPAEHPLARLKHIGMQDLQGEQVLLLEEGHCLRGQALDLCTRAGAGELAGFRATSLETLRHMIAARAGITLIPALAVERHLGKGSGSIVYIPFEEPAPTRTIAIMFRNTTSKRVCFANLARVIREMWKSTHNNQEIQ